LSLSIANNGLNNQINLPASVIGAGKSRQSANSIDKLNLDSIGSVKRGFEKHEQSSPNQLGNSRGSSAKSKIDPNLLDKVFKLKAKNEQSELSSNRPSDLYLQTETLVHLNVNEVGIGLDIYV